MPDGKRDLTCGAPRHVTPVVEWARMPAVGQVRRDDGTLTLGGVALEEIARIAARALAKKRVCRVSLRIDPGVDAEDIATHSYIATGHDDAKFGVPLSTLADALDRLARESSLRLVGLTSHVGSQFTDT